MQRVRGYAPVNGGHIYYEMIGDGSALLLVHGFSLDTRMWEDQIDVFASQYRVVCCDIRGFGRSDPPTRPFSQAGDLHALLSYLGIDQAAILGLSMGGGIATVFSLLYPEATRALMLADSNLWGLRWSPEGVAQWNEIERTAREQGVDAARRMWLNHPFFASARERPDLAARLRQMVEDYSGWHWINPDLEIGIRPPPLKRLGEIRAPTLVLVGERDVPDFRRISDVLAAQIPGARQVILPGVGHMSNMEDPDGFNRIVLEFLESIER
jgi:3-oxoadipate enol-lactonase